MKQITVFEEDPLTLQTKELIKNKEEIISRMKKLVIAKDHRILDFSTTDEEGFIEYIKDLKVRNLTSPLLHLSGVTILQVKAEADVIFDMHEHDNQAQVAYVSEGTIISENNIQFNTGESYFVSKKHTHSIKYLKGSKVLLVYLPNLNSL